VWRIRKSLPHSLFACDDAPVRMDDTAPSRKSSARALQSLACVLPARLAYATAHATLSSTLLPSVAPARSLLRLTSAFLRGSFRVLRSLV
jgi:hypothetical protein